MSIVKWSPMKELEEMRRDMERLFDEFFEPMRRRRWWGKPIAEGVIVPNIELIDKKDELIAKIEIPGVDKKDIDLTITENTMTVKGEIKKEEEFKEEDYYVSEIRYGSFSRTIPLPVEIDSDRAKASYKNGILEVVLPKKEEAKPKEIKVEVS
ncbi:MAG: Hsp20/alpha crystallin family protein [Nitrospirae bacterium]|nr:Hsp20/alpha crystallin family protein [Nitrospirota bacterium]